MTLEVAGRVAPGEVAGLDLETRLLEQADASAAAQGIDNVASSRGCLCPALCRRQLRRAVLTRPDLSLGELAGTLAKMRRVA
jgi:hypothetical protein